MARVLKWGAIGFGGFIVLLVVVVVSTPDSEESANAPSAGRSTKLLQGVTATPTATSGTRSDYIEFGIGENPDSDALGLVGVSKTFHQDTDLWLRMRLRKPAGNARVEFVLQHQQGGPGWYSLRTWFTTGDPDSNIFQGNPRTLRGLDPGDYKVFVLISDKKRAEGFFTILPATVLNEPSSTPLTSTPVPPTSNIIAKAAPAVPGTTQTIPTPPPSTPRTEFGGGTWRVGVDITPGIYRAEASDRCYWARI